MWECCKPEQVTGHNDPFWAAMLFNRNALQFEQTPEGI